MMIHLDFLNLKAHMWGKCGARGETILQLEIRILVLLGVMLVISSDWMREMAVRPAVCSGLSLRCPRCSSTQATTAATIGLVWGARRSNFWSLCLLYPHTHTQRLTHTHTHIHRNRHIHTHRRTTVAHHTNKGN